MWKIIALFLLVSLAAAEKASYENYKVFRIIPATVDQVETLRALEEIPDGLSFWQEPSFVGNEVDIMVAPHKVPEFQEIMNKAGIQYNVHIENVQTLIDQEAMSMTQSSSFDFTRYHALDEIHRQLDDLAAQNPGKVQVIVGGKSYEGRQIKGVKISFKPNNPGVFIEGGIHAREWISPATVMYIVDQLLNSKDADVRALAEAHDWWIFPSVNPDGYVYTHTTNRLWRKTRKPYGICVGADPNRNWDYKWMTGGASSSPCSETHAGSAPFSEPEMKSLSEYIKTVADKFYVYISFHSYSQLLLFPYGHTRDHLENHDELYQIGTKSITALRQRHGTEYVTGNIAETIYIATGGSIDYIKGIYHTPITYTYELRDKGRYGFLLPPNQIIPTGEETMDSLVAMFKEAKAIGYPKKV